MSTSDFCRNSVAASYHESTTRRAFAPIPSPATSFFNFYCDATDRELLLPAPDLLEQNRACLLQRLLLPLRSQDFDSSEDQMQEKTPPLLRLGNVMLEDTSHGIKDYFNQDSKQENVAALQSHPFIRHGWIWPDITVRLPTTGDPDDNLLRGDQPSAPLASNRVSPFNVISFVDIKKRNVPLDSDEVIKQLFDYADSLLRCDFRRQSVFVAAINGKQVIFLCVCFIDGEATSTRSPMIEDDDGLELATFLSTDPTTLNGCSLSAFHPAEIQLVQPLGRGSTGLVVEALAHRFAELVEFHKAFFDQLKAVWEDVNPQSVASCTRLTLFSVLKLAFGHEILWPADFDDVQYSEWLLAMLDESDETNELLTDPTKVEAADEWVRKVQRFAWRTVVERTDIAKEYLKQRERFRPTHTVVVKISKCYEELSAERFFLQWLGKYVQDCPVGPRQRKSFVFPRLADVPYLEEFAKSPSKGTYPHAIAITPRYRHKTRKLDLRHFQDAWTFLTKIHEVGVVHCDVRLPNLMWHEHAKAPAFIDWAFARFHSAESYVRGDIVEDYRGKKLQQQLFVSKRVATSTASTAVLDGMKDDGELPGDFELFPADDAVALIKMCLQVARAATLEKLPPAPKQLKRAWRLYFRRNDSNVGAIIDDITTQRRTIEPADLNQRVSAALELIFPKSSGGGEDTAQTAAKNEEASKSGHKEEEGSKAQEQDNDDEDDAASAKDVVHDEAS